MFANKSGRGDQYWRVQLGKRFTGGKRITRDFDSLQDAKRWVFGEAQKSKAEPGLEFDIREPIPAGASDDVLRQLLLEVVARKPVCELC